jgi:hypothetical protein
LPSQGNTPVAALTGTAITLGAAVSGTLSAAGEVDDYVFAVAGPTRLYFDSLAPSNSGEFHWSLLGPRGTEIADRSTYYSESYEFGNGNPVIDVPLAGRYQLRIRGNGNTTGNYSFRVLNLADGVAVTPGTPVTASLDPGNETDVYRFTANAGDRVFFDRQTFSPANSGWVSWRLLDPYGARSGGRRISTTTSTSARWRLPVSTRCSSRGASGARDSVARFDYSFNIQPVVDDPASALTIGDTVDGNIAHSRTAEQLQLLAGRRDLALFRQPEQQQHRLDPARPGWLPPQSQPAELGLGRTGPDQPAAAAGGRRLHADPRRQSAIPPVITVSGWSTWPTRPPR